MNKNELPTGYLFTENYSRGHLETLSIADYGKAHNVKADFLGLTKEITGVENVPCMPLSEKWVITLSTQYGCPMKCNFCDVPNIRFKGNATFDDLYDQLKNAVSMFPNVKYTERLNIHFARMGEPMFNPNVLNFTRWLQNSKRLVQKELGVRTEVIHPVFTTSMPKGYAKAGQILQDWCNIKNNLYHGQAGLQLSINSTDDAQRDVMFGGMAMSINEIASIAYGLPDPVSRKYCLNFAYSTDYIIDAVKLATLFDAEKFMVKITPIHNNNACRENEIVTIDGYNSYQPYRKVEEELKAAGFDVLVFVPSMDEEDGLVTCGNLVLGGGELKVDSLINIEGLET